ncbi:DsbA family protein [Vibrio sp. RE86]|uniref:DsbA family protein n=1 Tax=Vibrio sp. RE86 TaxID=2607605 RepID=UPI0014932C35|nr:DsbA family protein [Vibrio sp. RE86]NOH78288.1 DsbA family protein [Vibrio sp. RE86]
MFKKMTIALAMSVLISMPVLAASQQEKIAEIVQMLESNPQVVDGLHESLGMYIKQQQQFTQLLESSDKYINDPNHSFMGAENGEMTIINVTDYSCPFCKKLDVELAKLTKDYPQIKVVNLYVPLKEGSDSLSSAAYALNVWQQDREKYQQVHDLLVAKPGAHNAGSLMKIAQKTGTTTYLNMSDEVKTQLENNYAMFTGLGLRGTPALIMNEQVIPGYVPYEQLEKVVKEQL